MSARIEKLRIAVNGLAIVGCLVLAVVKGLVAFRIYEARSAGYAAMPGIGALLLVVAAVLILQRVRTGALLGILASIGRPTSIMFASGAFPVMAYVALSLIVLWLNAMAWKSMGGSGKSN